MAKNICPNCREVTLSLGEELFLKCMKCLAMFKVWVIEKSVSFNDFISRKGSNSGEARC